MARYEKPAEGSWTEHYPQLGTEPVSYEDSISPEFYEQERVAIFERAWLHVGRVEQIPRTGSYFTKEIVAAPWAAESSVTALPTRASRAAVSRLFWSSAIVGGPSGRALRRR